MFTACPRVDPPPRIRWPAGALTLLLHLAAATALVLLAGRPMVPASAERQRDVGIVLAYRDARGTVAYYREAGDPATTALVSATGAVTAPGGNQGSGGTLPGGREPAPPLIPGIALPAPSAAGASGRDVAAPGIRLGGGARGPLLPGHGDEAILAEEAEWRAARQLSGPPVRVAIFGSPAAVGRSFVFAIDRSGSMGGQGLNALAAARDELARAVAELEDSHKFQIIGYNHTCQYFHTTRLIAADPENAARVRNFIDNLSAFGGTLHEMALRAALALEPDAVFLLTDGGDPPLDEIQLSHVQKSAEGRTAIHCIQFGRGPQPEEDNFLKRVARQNRGTYTYVDMQRR